MAVRDRTEFEQLFVAYSNGDLTDDERARMHQLAGQDVTHRGALAEVDAVHEMLRVEVDQRRRVMRPVETAEEADQGYVRLTRAAARAEEQLRARLLTPTLIDPGPPPYKVAGAAPTRARTSRRWRSTYMVAAVALVLLAWWVGILIRGDMRPALDKADPAPQVLGADEIRVTTRVSADSPELSWFAADDATTYQAAVLDARDRIVLERADAARRSTSWLLTTREFATLSGHDGRLFLRVIARDKQGEEVARTRSAQPIDVVR